MHGGLTWVKYFYKDEGIQIHVNQILEKPAFKYLINFEHKIDMSEMCAMIIHYIQYCLLHYLTQICDRQGKEWVIWLL